MFQQIEARLPAGQRRRLKPLRWAKVFAAHASLILSLLISPRSMSGRAKARRLKHLKRQALDPDINRYDIREVMGAVQMPWPA